MTIRHDAKVSLLFFHASGQLMVQLALPQESHWRAFGFSFAPQRTQEWEGCLRVRVAWKSTKAPKAARNMTTAAQEPV
jgi:hypothetical protein